MVHFEKEIVVEIKDKKISGAVLKYERVETNLSGD